METTSKEIWQGSKMCNFCQKPCGRVFIDGRTNLGPWAVMCEPCYARRGIGLGQGSGQKYKLNSNNEYVKVAG
jgi:hypothetical protein